MCRSYLEHWFRESDKKVDKDTRDVLAAMFTPELLKSTDNGPASMSAAVVKATANDPKVSIHVKDMKSAGFRKFYKAYVDDKVGKPCSRYVEAMPELMKIAQRFGILESIGIGEHFERPSAEFEYSLRLYKLCKHSIGPELVLKVEPSKLSQ